MRVGAIIQARTSSSRLPGKMLTEVGGKSLLAWVAERLEHAGSLDEIVLATSAEASDDALAALGGALGLPVVRGALDDVAGRMLLAARERGLDAFVRVNGDSPLLDPRLVDRGVDLLKATGADLASNVVRRTFPKGESVEVLDTAAYGRAYEYMTAKEHLEHVTAYLYAHPAGFTIESFESGHDWGAIQLSVDSPEDLERFSAIARTFDRPHWEYGVDEIVSMLPALEGSAA